MDNKEDTRTKAYRYMYNYLGNCISQNFEVVGDLYAESFKTKKEKKNGRKRNKKTSKC